MEATLNLVNRYLLKSLLAQHKGRYAEYVLAKKVADDVLSDDEVLRWHVRLNGGQFTHDAGFNPEIKVKLGDEAVKMIATDLRMLEEAGQLPASHGPLYELFVLNKKAAK